MYVNEKPWERKNDKMVTERLKYERNVLKENEEEIVKLASYLNSSDVNRLRFFFLNVVDLKFVCHPLDGGIVRAGFSLLFDGGS